MNEAEERDDDGEREREKFISVMKIIGKVKLHDGKTIIINDNKSVMITEKLRFSD